jgi:hypothetical protein
MPSNFSMTITVKDSDRKAPPWSLGGDLNGEVSLAKLLFYTKEALIRISQDVLREEQAKGFDKDPVTIVDKKRYNVPIETVSPLGQIEFVSRKDAGDVMLFAYQQLIDKSPRLTGKYEDYHLVFLNGKMIARNHKELLAFFEGNPKITDRDRFRFVNTVPYAAALEYKGISKFKRGGETILRNSMKTKKSKRSSTGSVRVPNGVYTLTTKALKSKFKGIGYIKFEFLNGGALGITSPIPGRSGTFGNAPFRTQYMEGSRWKGPYVYPSILIGIAGRGIIQ